ncbi:uncharacterized protein AB675_7056 [Cyphellophora attinorum]|uniref:t-SNARE coiled-coil homology domain-containing protein n=1 Tax=Cyphellophora attinorum TaxID=1664694 RepID=A0A0N1HYD9_9EURO|nr:uncharacterized protein AB675_7056 [Phialophora attinorum]KPI43403.1 hypothetical protein AB675_7056 [Phialophora attinorum]
MSLAATLRPFSPNAPNATALRYGEFTKPGATNNTTTRSFFQDPSYLTLTRQLAHLSHLILLTPDPRSFTNNNDNEDLTPLQQQTQADLSSPLPYHRTKWLHNIDGARTLLLQLERKAQSIQGSRTRGNVQRDLVEKRGVVRKLRARVEEYARDAERERGQYRDMRRGGDEALRWTTTAASTDEGEPETLWDVLVQQREEKRKRNAPEQDPSAVDADTEATSLTEDDTTEKEERDRDALLHTSSTLTRRRGTEQETFDKANSTSFKPPTTNSNLSAHEKTLLSASRDQEDLSTSLLSMAAQLKQQAKAFQFSLDQDQGILGRAMEGLDRNIGGMEAASKNMQFLKRMSEGEGWLGRMKLYAMIGGMWRRRSYWCLLGRSCGSSK